MSSEMVFLVLTFSSIAFLFFSLTRVCAFITDHPACCRRYDPKWLGTSRHGCHVRFLLRAMMLMVGYDVRVRRASVCGTARS